MRVFFDAFTAKKILEALEKGVKEAEISLDLGITTRTVSLEEYQTHKVSLKKIATKEGSVFFLEDGEFFQAAISEDHYYKLFSSYPNQPPALLIDGVLMHRVKETDPMTDARSKARLCANDGSRMLEICTGIGYSTIACLERGIASIETIEINPHVLNLARLNPWSEKLFTDERVNIIEGDASVIISTLEDNTYDAILHDPPRFSMGSTLYTSDFYYQLFRLLKRNGVLFHYVGSPGGSHRRVDLQKGIMQRLRTVGFIDVERKPTALGLVAKKP